MAGRKPLPPEQRKPKLSGAQRAALAKAAQIADLLAQLAKLGWRPPLAGPARVVDSAVSPYEKLGPPPTSPVGVISWANQAGALLLHEILTDPNLSAHDRRKMAGDMIQKIGMTHSKAVTDKKLAELQRRLEGPKASEDDPGEDVAEDDWRGARSPRAGH